MGTVTMEDIARRAGVSRALVSMAFRDVPGVAPPPATTSSPPPTPWATASTGSRRDWPASGHDLRGFLLDLRQDVYADMFDGISAVAKTNDKHIVMAVGPATVPWTPPPWRPWRSRRWTS